MGRFNLLPLLRGQLKGLTLATGSKNPADWFARSILFGIPALLAVLGCIFGWKLAAPVPILTAVSLLAGGTLSAFSSLSSLRLKLSEWSEHNDGRDGDRDSLDESVSHLFMVALACVLDAAVLVVGLNASRGAPGTPDQDAIVGIPAHLAVGLTAYVFLAFIMVLPRLYWAYTTMNNVSRKLNGFDAT